MKKRSACKILVGIVALGAVGTGHCGQITLSGTTHPTMTVDAVFEGVPPYSQNEPYEMGFGCAVCLGFHGPCMNSTPRDVRVVSKNNAAKVTVSRGVGYAGYSVQWFPGDSDTVSTTRVRLTCDNTARADWGWVNMGFHRWKRYPVNAVRVTATNESLGVTDTHEWPSRIGHNWYPKWDAVHTEGSGDSRTIRVTYADEVQLRGKGSKARVLYGVVGTAPVTARIDKLPTGLSCARTPDGLNIEPGVSAVVGTGDSITCTNELRKSGQTSDTLSVTAMIR